MFSVPMPLVMFADACEHLVRVCRVLRQHKWQGVVSWELVDQVDSLFLVLPASCPSSEP